MLIQAVVRSKEASSAVKAGILTENECTELCGKLTRAYSLSMSRHFYRKVPMPLTGMNVIEGRVTNRDGYAEMIIVLSVPHSVHEPERMLFVIRGLVRRVSWHQIKKLGNAKLISFALRKQAGA